jgi:four helix bundle protein
MRTERREVVDIRKRTFRFGLRVVQLCQILDERPGVGRTLGKQLLRSGTSVGANIHEAQAGQSKLDFISKNAIALKEAHETAYWLDLICEAGIVQPNQLNALRAECNELIAILTTIVKNARANLRNEKTK